MSAPCKTRRPFRALRGCESSTEIPLDSLSRLIYIWTMKIAAYYRVSSRAQDLAMQRSAVERAALARGDSIEVVYSEKKSAKTTNRLQLIKLRQDAREGKIKRL